MALEGAAAAEHAALIAEREDLSKVIAAQSEEGSAMAEFAPQAIKDLFVMVDAAIPVAVNSGIVGSTSHTTGYHRSRGRLLATGHSSDYSILSSPDKLGDADACCALDISFPPAEMKIVTKRVIDACIAGDSRVAALREVLGTVDGKVTTGYNRIATGSGSRSKVGILPSSAISSDHLWHLHLSLLRRDAENSTLMKAIAAVIIGLPAVVTPAAKIIINGREYDDLTSVSVSLANDARDRGVFSRHVFYIQSWLGSGSSLIGRQAYWDAPTQVALNAFRTSLGWTGADVVGEIGMTSLSILRSKAGSTKPLRA